MSTQAKSTHPLKPKIEELEEREIRASLKRCDGIMTRVATDLVFPLRTLYTRCGILEIDPTDYRL